MTVHDRAASILLGTSSGNDPDWTWWVDAAELAWHRATSLAALGDQHAALDLFREAYETRPLSAHRARYNDLAHLVDAQVVARSWAEAESSLVDVLAELGEMARPPGPRSSCGVRRQLSLRQVNVRPRQQPMPRKTS